MMDSKFNKEKMGEEFNVRGEMTIQIYLKPLFT
jgi:hypothetical protein